MKKKILSSILTVGMLVSSIAGCGGSATGTAAEPEEETAPAEEPAEEA